MKIIREQSKYHRFALYYDYSQDKVDFCRELKESFGWDRISFAADGNLKRWVFSESLFIPIIAEKFPEVSIDRDVEEIVSAEQKWSIKEKKKAEKIDEIRIKTDTEFNVKGLKKALYTYQKIGVEFLVESGGRAIIADQMGLGKTCQAIAYAKHMKFKRCLIVCPASVKFTWENEIKKWTGMSSVIIDSKTDLAKIDADINFWIINYDILKKHYGQLSKIRFDNITGDECVIPQTYIATREGQKQVIDLKEGEDVLTYNLKEKKYEYKPIKKIVKKPLLKKLTQVGNLICTDDHKIYDGKNFIEARKVKKTFPMDFIPIKDGSSDEVLAGCLMGDGNLALNKGKNKKSTNSRLRIGNCLRNEDYIKMKCRIIDELKPDRLKRVWNAGFKPSFFFKAQSLTYKKLTLLYKKTYKKGERIVDYSILNMMGAAGLAVWLQDDGYVWEGVTALNTQRYKLKGNIDIKKWFEQKYQIYPNIAKEKKKDGRIFYRLNFGVKDSLKIYKIIRDYIVPSMRYKFVSLEERFNKIHTNTCKICGQRMFGLHFVAQNAVNRKKVCNECRAKFGTKVSTNGFVSPVPYDCVYDLEIEENHNFFADGILVHNCQLIKTVSAMRTKAFRAISRNIPSVVLLSGTPLLSRPSELFSLLNIIDEKTWSNWYAFARKYCNMHQTRWGMDTSGASNIEELHAKIRRYFIRRDKSEVLKELPPKTFINVPVKLDRETENEYSTAANNLAEYLRQYAGKQNAEISKAMAAEKLTQLNILRQVNAVGKLKTAKELIESIVDAGEKVLVFCSFVEPLEMLKDAFGDKAVIITGKTPVEERGDVVEAFQNDKKVNIFLGGYKSAGVGLTLTAASSFIGLDFPWNPADLQQSIDRLHRPGQKANAVNIYQLSVINTIDDDMKDTLDHKQGIFDQVIDGKEAKKIGSTAMKSAVQRVLKNY